MQRHSVRCRKVPAMWRSLPRSVRLFRLTRPACRRSRVQQRRVSLSSWLTRLKALQPGMSLAEQGFLHCPRKLEGHMA